MSLPVFSLPSGLTNRPDQSSVQTVLALGTSSRPEVGSSAVAPPMNMEDSRCWKRACWVDRIVSRCTADSRLRMGIQRLACSFITCSSWSSSVRQGRLAYCTIHQRSGWMSLERYRRWPLLSTCKGTRALCCPIFRYCRSSPRRCTACRPK